MDVPTCSNDEEGDVRLIDGVSIYEGRIEVCTGGEWGTICNYNWDSREAVVICRQLGFPSVGVLASRIFMLNEFTTLLWLRSCFNI